MDKADIPYAFVDQKIDGLNYQVYWGADPREAGQLGAYLLTHRMEVKHITMPNSRIHLIEQARPPHDCRRPYLLSKSHYL